MKYLNIVLSVFFYTTLSTFCMEQPQPPKHVVVDLDGIIVEPNTSQAVSSLGWFNVLCKGFNALNLQTDFFAVLEKILPHDPTHTEKVVWKGQQAPRVIYEFLTGKKPCKQLANDIKAGIKKQNRSDEKLMLNLADITFNPKKNAEIMQLIPDGVQVLKELHQQNCTVHMLANCNHEVWQHLRKRFPTEFSYINGHTLISGSFGKIKGPDLYKEFCQRAGIANPDDCVFIETEHVYAQALHDSLTTTQKKPKAIVCVNKDINSLRKQLMEHGLLQQSVHHLMPQSHHRRNSSQTVISSSSH